MVKITQRSQSRGEIAPILHGRSDLAVWTSGLALCENAIITKEGVWATRGGTRMVRELKTMSKKAVLIDFVFSAADACVIELGDGKARFHRYGGTIMTSPGGDTPYELTTPWAEADLADLWWTQSADVLFVCHPNYPTKEIRRAADNSWSIADFSHEKGPFTDMNRDQSRTVKISATTGSGITITPTGFSFVADDVGKLIRIERDDRRLTPQWSPDTEYNPGDQVTVGGRTYFARGDGPTNSGINPPVHTRGRQKAENVVGVTTWEYLHDGYGIAKITGVAGGEATATILSRMPDELVDTASPLWSLSPWSPGNGYPEIVEFVEDRLTFARCKKFPTTLWLSNPSDYSNFEEGSEARHAIQLALNNRRINAISWLWADDVLGVGTAGQEWAISASRDGEALTPTNRRGRPQSSEGSAKSPCLSIDGAAVFISRSRKRLHEFVFGFELNRWETPEISILAEHITKKGIEQIVWAPDPYRIIWLRLSDGSLAGVTYRRSERVAAWFRCPMENAFIESIACIPSAGATHSELWMIVRRQIDGATVRYIEVMEPVFDWEGETDAAMSWQLDCALRYEGAPATVISGLDHLEGETVGILADGKVQPPQEVTDGKITLNAAASVVLVGLPFRARGQTLGIDLDLADGSTAGRAKKVGEITLKVIGSVGGRAGPVPDHGDPDRLLELLQPSGGGVMDKATPLQTTELTVKPLSGWSKHGGVRWEQSQPLPLIVQTVSVDVDLEDA